MMEDIFDIINFRRDPERHLLRGLLLRNIFHIPVMLDNPREEIIFNLDHLDPIDVKLQFRFEKEDIPRLVRALRIPDIIRTEENYICTGTQGVCILLRRLAYPNRLVDLVPIFGLCTTALSHIANCVIQFILRNHGHLLSNLNNLPWLNRDKMRYYADAITAKGAAVQNCFGFIDGTARAICRPSIDQQEYYSGHKRMHCVKYQSVICPDGIVISLKGAYTGRRHDAGIFRESAFYNELEDKAVFENENFVIFGDQAYGIRELLLCPYPGQGINQHQQQFNNSMSIVRIAVEWGFQKIIQQFAFLDFKKNQKLLVQDLEAMYKVAVLLTNCHTCLYNSLSGQYFHINPPQLEEYLGVGL